MSKAERLLQKMKQSPAGWKPHDFQTLYLGFGFKMINGKKHDIFIHPDFPQLRDTIPRHDEELSKAYARQAIKNIETLSKLQGKAEENDE